MVNGLPKGEKMTRIYCSFSDGNIYVLHENCDLKTLMDEQAGYDGILICVSKGLFEMVEYVNGKRTSFTTKTVADVNNINDFEMAVASCLCAYL